MTITAAADGSSLGNPGPTGWAWYIDDDRWAAGGFPKGTNNIGELTAVAELLDATAHVDEPLHILCDSKYVIDSCTKWMRGWKYNGWKKKDGKPVLNVELMQRLDAAMQGRKVTFQWVKGHAGHHENEAADDRARAVAEAYSRGREPEAHLLGPGFDGVPDASGSVDLRDRDVRGAASETAESPAAENAAEAALLDVRGDGSLPLWDDEPDVDDLLEVVELERSLVDPAVRSNRALLDELLHDAFVYVSADGRHASRTELIERLTTAAGPAPEHVGPLSASAVAPGVRLVLGDEEIAGRRTAHASLWVFETTGPGDGRWRLRFHQATPIA